MISYPLSEQLFSLNFYIDKKCLQRKKCLQSKKSWQG